MAARGASRPLGRRRLVAALLTAAVAAVSVVLWSPGRTADAFKPFTHNQTGFSAWSDATTDGYVTIAGRSYQVPPKVTAALRAWPAHYNAGVIGPDGFPDLIMGQSIIHPENTGMWLRYILKEAWDAQDSSWEPLPVSPWANAEDPNYNDAEEGQILAFAYGFLTHAAGDVWSHTLINEMSGEVFPGVLEILADQSAREVAMRHLMLEGYIGAATSGFDTDPEETRLANGDVAGDNTEGVPFAVPLRFVYATLVKRDAVGAPTTERGKVIDFFYGLREQLVAFETVDPTPLEDAVGRWNNFQDTVDAAFRQARCDDVDNDGDSRVDEGCGFFDDAEPDNPAADEGYSGDCNFGGGYDDGFVIALDVAHDAVACPLVLGASLIANTVQAALDLVVGTTAYLAKQVLDAYVTNWIADIDSGLRNWGQLGLALTKGLFDPQTKRDAQNDECSSSGADVITATPAASETNLRRRCENGIGTIDAVMWAADDFISDHLLSMLGAPDFIGGLREALQEVSSFVDGIVGPALNPIRMVSNAIKDWAKALVKTQLTERYGLPIDQIEVFLEEPTTRLDTQSLSTPAVTLSVLGLYNVNIPSQTLTLLGPSKRAELDRYLGLAAHAPFTPLSPSERFNPNDFKAYKNAVTLGKLLLLDGAGMDQVLSDLTGTSYSLYNAGANFNDPASNVMTTVFPTASVDADTAAHQWLRMIDGDHAWRQDGLPVFSSDDHGPGGDLRAGEGNFPLFESCLLRKRVFRRLFQDWENDDTRFLGDNDGQLDPVENFPDFGDSPSPDPNSPISPMKWMTIGSPSVFDRDTVWVTARTPLAIDAYASTSSRSSLTAGWRVNADTFAKLPPGVTFNLAGIEEGEVEIEYTVENDCDGGEPTATKVTLDLAPPVVFFPFADSSTPSFDTNTNLGEVLAFDVGDGNGVGVDEEGMRLRLNGRLLPQGFNINTSRLPAGLHSVEVVATDLLGNTASKSATFRVVATLESLQTNLFSFWMSGAMDSEQYELLQKLVTSAVEAHDSGRHSTEWKLLNSLIAELQRQRDIRVKYSVAVRLENYVRSILTSETSPAQSPGLNRRALSRP